MAMPRTQSQMLDLLTGSIAKAKDSVVEAQRVHDEVVELFAAEPDTDVTRGAFLSLLGCIVAKWDPREIL